MARSKHIVFTKDTVDNEDFPHNHEFINVDLNSPMEVPDSNKLQVPAAPRQLSWRESLVQPFDFILPSPTSPGGSIAGSSIVTNCMHCPNRRRHRSSEGSDFNPESSNASNQNPSSRQKRHAPEIPTSQQEQIMQYSSPHNAVQLRDKNYPSPYQTSQLQASPSTHQASHLQASPSTHQTNHLRDKDLEQRLMKVEEKFAEVERKGSQSSLPQRPVQLQFSEKRDSSDSCFSCCNKKDKDDVDGPEPVNTSFSISNSGTLQRLKKSSATASASIIDAFIRLIFLKILFIDIGISLGDLVMDFIQGLNLILQGPQSISFPYGVALLASCWIPCLAAPLHLGIVNYKELFKKRGIIEALVLILLYISLFPLIPTVCYICLLLTPRTSRVQRQRYREVERKAHEIKSITASVEAPLQLTLILYLMLRGILHLPWNEPMSSKCIEDSLGRVACIPSIPMLSAIFSVLSILKSMFDLNIHPLLANKECGVGLLNESFLLFLRYFPFSVANILFRISSFAFILVYLDYWTTVPALLLLLCNLIIFGYSFTRLSRVRHRTGRSAPLSEPEPDNARLDDFDEASNLNSSAPPLNQDIGWDSRILNETNINTFSTADFVKKKDNAEKETGSGSPSPKSFKVQESEISKNIFLFSEASPTNPSTAFSPSPYNPSVYSNNTNMHQRHTVEPPIYRQTRTNSFKRVLSRLSSIRSENDHLPSVINEGDTSIFFNSLSGLFFPSCHAHIKPFCSSSEDPPISPSAPFNIHRLIAWQNIILKRQVYTFNSMLLIVLVFIWCLVSLTPFNYNSNVLDPFWFNITFGILVCLWLVTIVLAYELTHPLQGVLRPLIPSLCDSPVTESQRDIKEANSKDQLDYSFRERKAKSGSWMKRMGVSFLLSLLLLVPPLIPLIGYEYGNSPQPYIFLINGSRETVNLGIIATFPVHQASNTNYIVGEIDTSCIIDEADDFQGKILVLNTSRPLCRILIEKDNLYNLTTRTGVAGILILDSTPKQEWRVSSPYDSQYNHNYAELSIPVLMAREADWKEYDQFLQTQSNQISIVYEESIPNLEKLFSCTRRNKLNLGDVMDSSCNGGKYISNKGDIKENICVQGKCSQYGQRCISSFFSKFESTTVSLECEATELEGIELEFNLEDHTLENRSKLQLPRPQGGEEEYCCRDPSMNSTFLEVYQDIHRPCFTSWSDVDASARSCQQDERWSHWVKSACTQTGRNVVRFCIVQSQCIIKEYYVTKGCSTEMVDFCQNNMNKCTSKDNLSSR